MQPNNELLYLNLSNQSFFGLDFIFFNLTLYSILAIIVILFLSYVITKSLSLIPNYWQSVIEIFYSFIFSVLIDQAGKKAKVFFPAIFSLFFFILVSSINSDTSEFNQMMMLGFFRSQKKTTIDVVISKTIITNLIKNIYIFERKYSSKQKLIDSLVLSKRTTVIDDITETSMCNKLIHPVSKKNDNLHNLDLMLQKSYKKFNLTLNDLINNFNLNNFFATRPNLNLIKSQLYVNKNSHILYQRSNTIGELTCIEASKRNFSFLKSIDMTWGQNIDSHAAALTGNIKPDYACCIIYDNGRIPHYYHADLKQTSLISFEKMVNRLHPNQMINTNIYWIDDKNFAENYVFQGLTKIKLETTYFGVMQFYMKLNPSIARHMYIESDIAFNIFKRTGLASDYNKIPLNTPKFIFTSWIEKLF